MNAYKKIPHQEIAVNDTQHKKTAERSLFGTLKDAVIYSYKL